MSTSIYTSRQSRSHSPSSPTSPTSWSATRSSRTALPYGFRPAPRPKRVPLEQLTVRELEDAYDRNARILAEPAASSSTYVQRISMEQAELSARLNELSGLQAIQTGMKNTHIVGEDAMSIDAQAEQSLSRAQEAKRKALSRFGIADRTDMGTLSLHEAIELEQRAHQLDKERRERIEAKNRRLGLPVKGETRKEREARMWAFMNAKPSDSDIEDESDEDSDNEDPATWFEDYEDDGVKGQPIVHPDSEDLANIIRVDYDRLHTGGYSSFYEPRD